MQRFKASCTVSNPSSHKLSNIAANHHSVLHSNSIPTTANPGSRDDMVELASFVLSYRFTSLGTPDPADAALPGEIVWGIGTTKEQLIKRLNLIHHARCELSIDFGGSIQARDVETVDKDEEMLSLMLAYMAHKCSEHLIDDLGMATAIKVAAGWERFYRIKRRELETGRDENGDLIGDQIKEIEEESIQERKNMTATGMLIGRVLVLVVGLILGWTVCVLIFLWLLMTPLVFCLEG